jgi:hypothetical protein
MGQSWLGAIQRMAGTVHRSQQNLHICNHVGAKTPCSLESCSFSWMAVSHVFEKALDWPVANTVSHPIQRMDMCSHWLIPVQGLLENLRNTMVFTHTSHTYIYISSLKCSLHSRYPPDVANMIHAIDIVQQDDMMDDHPTSWRCGWGYPIMGAMDAMGISSPSVGRWGLHLKQEKGTGHYWSQHLFCTQVRQQKKRTFLLM